MPQRKIETELLLPLAREQWWLLCTIRPVTMFGKRDIFEVTLQRRSSLGLGEKQDLMVNTARYVNWAGSHRKLLQASAYDEVVLGQGRLFRKFTATAAEKLCGQKLKNRQERARLRRSILLALEQELQQF